MTHPEMAVIRALRPGGPDVLALETAPRPTPQAHELLVEVAAAGVNFFDTYRRAGIYDAPFPHIVGTEGAGIVTAIGSAVTHFAVGDRVAWHTAPNSYAEYVAVPETGATKVPDDIDLETAAALMLQGMTAHYLARSTAPVQPGQTVLVHAAAGGVGRLLVQLAHSRGATVIGTVSTPVKADLAQSAGADHVIRYDELDDLTTQLPERVHMVAPEGVNTVFDGVGKATFDASLASLRRRGVLVLFGASSGPVPPFDPQRLNAAGSLYLTRPTLGDYTADREEFDWRARELFDAVRDGSLKVRISHRYPLSEAAQAHRDLEARKSTGKFLLIP